MSRCTERDRRFYYFLVKTRLPMTITDVAHMFYPSPSGNERSSITIAQRRCRELKKMQYIEISNRSFGSCNYYYVGSKPNERSLRHRLLMSHVISTISCNGFNIIDVETEKSFMDSINKMSRESQSAIYSPKMAETLGLAAADATPENIQREIRRTFSDLRAGNVSEQTVLTIEQLKKSLETAKRISDLATVNSGKKENGGDKK